MFQNYLKVTLRILYREKIYALINLIGLSIGFSCCLLLSIFLKDQLTFDLHNVNSDQIFRLAEENVSDQRTFHSRNTAGAVAPQMAANFPQINNYVRFKDISFSSLSNYFRNGDIGDDETSILYAENSVFEIFTFDVIYGDPSTALVDPDNIAISNSFSRKYFGDENPIGRTLSTDSSSYAVTLVFSDLPENTHLKYDALISYSSLPDSDDPLTDDNQHYTYFLMQDNYDAESFSALSNSFNETFRPGEGRAQINFYLEPLADIHFNSIVEGDRQRGNSLSLYASIIGGLFILVVACINYANLATARATKRAREVGVRKLAGAGKKQLIIQFVGEAVFFAFLALLLGYFISQFVLSVGWLSHLLGDRSSSVLLSDSITLILLIALTSTVGIISGLYPALYLSSIMPLTAIKGIVKRNKSRPNIRLALMLIQFVLTITTISATLLMFQQLTFIESMSLGFDRTNKLIISVKESESFRMDTLQNQLEGSPNILRTATANVWSAPNGSIGEWPMNVEDRDGDKGTQFASLFIVGAGYIDALGIKIQQGRDFNKELVSDINGSVIVNEAMVEHMGWDSPIGMEVSPAATPVTGTVIGVVEDFHFQGLHQQLGPLVLIQTRTANVGVFDTNELILQSTKLILDIAPNSMSEALEFITSVWDQFDPLHPLDIENLDESLSQLYFSESQQVNLIGGLAILLTAVTCLGLFGLSAFSIQQRTKEIGIRKILGASPISIILMLTKNLFALVAIASIISALITLQFVDRWLEAFYYHKELDPITFLSATVITLVLAIGTSVVQSVRTVSVNPIRSLRYE